MLISFQEIAWLFTVSLAMTPLIRCIWIWWVWLILFFRWYPPAFGAPLDSIKWLCIWILLEMILLFILGCSGVNIFTNSFLLILGSFPIAWIISASLESASLITISWSSHLNPIFTPPFALPFILPFTPPSTLSWWLNASKFIFGKVILKMSSLFSFRELSLLFNSRKKNAHLPLIWNIGKTCPGSRQADWHPSAHSLPLTTHSSGCLSSRNPLNTGWRSPPPVMKCMNRTVPTRKGSNQRACSFPAGRGWNGHRPRVLVCPLSIAEDTPSVTCPR